MGSLVMRAGWFMAYPLHLPLGEGSARGGRSVGSFPLGHGV